MYVYAHQLEADLLLQNTPPEVKEESGVKSSHTSAKDKNDAVASMRPLYSRSHSRLAF